MNRGTPPPRNFAPGGTFLHYEILSLLGEGGSGTVWLIRHPMTGELFALKVILLHDRADAAKVARAVREAKATASIDHANIVKLLDMNCEPDGLVWMRLEYLPGEDLARLLARQGRLSAVFALSATIEAAHALASAHENQIIHRDVKPSNLIYSNGRVKLIDLSTAKVFGAGDLETTFGRGALGTPAYMAPEQLRGEQAAPGHDEYSLGMTLYEMLAGRSPLHDVLHDREELLRKQFREMPPPLAGVHGLPREIDEAVSRMIAKDPKERFGSMKRVAQELTTRRAWLLTEWSARRIVHVIPPGEPTPPGDPLSRRDYLPPEPTPIHDPPSPFPAARVVVPESQPASGPAAPVSTTPLGEHRGLSGTIPLDSDAAMLVGPLTGRGTAILRAPPAAPAAGPREVAPPSLPRPSSPRWLPSDPVGRPQETPPAVTRPAQSTMDDTGPHARAGSAPARARRQVFWSLLMVAVAISSALSFGLVRWLGGGGVSGAAPIMPADAGAEAASAPQPKAKKSPK